MTNIEIRRETLLELVRLHQQKVNDLRDSQIGLVTGGTEYRELEHWICFHQDAISAVEEHAERSGIWTEQWLNTQIEEWQ